MDHQCAGGCPIKREISPSGGVEEEGIRRELRLLTQKLERSWNNFMNADPEFIDIAVMEIYRDELEYTILHRKLQCVTGKIEAYEAAAIEFRPVRRTFEWRR
ncbi:MAG: hypothetical protein LBT22_09245 [Peptococcaceae bacterium]|jgi:hypothetical protein|nr:hypothetical protein [Peptococcaceae bacterium]